VGIAVTDVSAPLDAPIALLGHAFHAAVTALRIVGRCSRAALATASAALCRDSNRGIAAAIFAIFATLATLATFAALVTLAALVHLTAFATLAALATLSSVFGSHGVLLARVVRTAPATVPAAAGAALFNRRLVSRRGTTCPDTLRVGLGIINCHPQ
jgi:hypothetical protein